MKLRSISSFASRDLGLPRPDAAISHVNRRRAASSMIQSTKLRRPAIEVIVFN